MDNKAINLLDRVIRDIPAGEKPKREKRFVDLLKDPFAETVKDWYMCVPSCFNDAMDIKQTERIEHKKLIFVWTQGSSFSFKEGDILYDSFDAYKVWSEALKTFSLCVQIKTASSAGPLEGVPGRFSGTVTFSILTPNEDRSNVVQHEEHTMSQDDFVRFLIAGPTDDLTNKINSPQLSQILI